MFHTTLLFQKIHSSDYYSLSSSLADLSRERKARHYPDPICPDLHIYTLYSEFGIIIMLRRRKSKGSQTFSVNEHVFDPNGQYMSYHAIEIRLNPKVLIEENEYVKVARESDYREIYSRFKQVLKPLQKLFEEYNSKKVYRFNDLSTYQVNRFDYCINIRTELHEDYMELIRRADVPAKFKVIYEVDADSGRRKNYKQSFYIQTEKRSVTINIYNKEYQMHREFEGYERLDDASKIIRIEIQCFPAKTNNMKQKHKWEYRDFMNFANDDIARDMIYSYYEKTVGFEDYFTLDEAKRLIQSCDKYQQKTKENMIKVVMLVNQKRSIYKARLAYSDDLGNREDVEKFNKIIKKIRKSGINPVTIPVNWGYEHIPNLVEGMDKEFTRLLRIVIN